MFLDFQVTREGEIIIPENQYVLMDAPLLKLVSLHGFLGDDDEDDENGNVIDSNSTALGIHHNIIQFQVVDNKLLHILQGLTRLRGLHFSEKYESQHIQKYYSKRIVDAVDKPCSRLRSLNCQDRMIIQESQRVFSSWRLPEAKIYHDAIDSYAHAYGPNLSLLLGPTTVPRPSHDRNLSVNFLSPSLDPVASDSPEDHVSGAHGKTAYLVLQLLVECQRWKITELESQICDQQMDIVTWKTKFINTHTFTREMLEKLIQKAPELGGITSGHPKAWQNQWTGN
ncbi:hypothetical protein L208DRAFT_1382609 [Tricholoma matsutake]|nr:hypothetical protein L208DRAFT_1382609 [Tricholoma matsutake 945]